MVYEFLVEKTHMFWQYINRNVIYCMSLDSPNHSEWEEYANIYTDHRIV